MEKNFKILVIAALLVTSPLVMLAQSPPHPNNGANPGIGNGPVGGGAPIGSGTLILFSLAMAYAMRKFNKERQNEQGWIDRLNNRYYLID